MPSGKPNPEPEPDYADAELGAEIKRQKPKGIKRPRSSNWPNLALGLANKNNFSQSAPPLPSLPSSWVTRKQSISLVSPSSSNPNSVTAGVSSRRISSDGQITMNVDNVFSGKCYEPRPVRITEGYSATTWTPVPINETTIQLTDSESKCTVNLSHQDMDFYHRELSREEVFHMFQAHGGVPGLCLVRDGSRTPGHYTLTVWEGKSAVNYRIEFAVRSGQPQYLLSGRTSFTSIAEILLFLHNNPQFFPAAPTMYIPRLPDGVKDILSSKHFVSNLPCCANL